MLDVRQFREFVVRPVLLYLSPDIPYSLAAENLLIGTALQESRLRFLDQLTPGPGPAYGLFQMEARTHDDHWGMWIGSRPGLRTKMHTLLAPWPTPLVQLRTNLAYAAAMTRVHYRRVSAPLPAADDVRGLAAYWRQWYNTPYGKGTVEKFIASYTAALSGPPSPSPPSKG